MKRTFLIFVFLFLGALMTGETPPIEKSLGDVLPSRTSSLPLTFFASDGRISNMRRALIILRYSWDFKIPIKIASGLMMEESRGDETCWSDNGWVLRGKKWVYLGKDEGLFQHNSRNHAWFVEKFNNGVEFSPYDPEANTRVALGFLSYLYKKYGSWYVALCAYNGNPYKPTKKTKAYVERILSGESLKLS